MRWRMSSAGIGATTTLLGSSPSGQAAIPVKSDTRFILVLGGGGMKGLAHIGVLQALTERGLLPTHIVGTSVGALVGAAWSAGHSVAELREIAIALRRKDIFAVDVSASNAFRADVQDEGFASVFARATEIAMQSLLEWRLRAWTTPPIYYVHPRVEHISPFSFDHLRELVEEGYRATAAALDHPDEWPRPGDAGVYPKRSVIVRVQRERCIGCGACLVQAPPGMFVLDAQGKAVVTRPEQEWSPVDGEFIRHCPTYAISARPKATPQAAGAAG